MTLSMKITASVFSVLTYIITSIDSSPYQTCSDNVCLDHHNCSYSTVYVYCQKKNATFI